MRKNFSEIFDEVEKAKGTPAKIQILRDNQSSALVELLKGIYNPGIKFNVKTLPKYKASDAPVGLGLTSIDMEVRRAYLFQPGHPKRPVELTEARSVQILTQVLEGLEAREAEIFGNMLLKKLNYPSMSRRLVESAFPGQI